MVLGGHLLLEHLLVPLLDGELLLAADHLLHRTVLQLLLLPKPLVHLLLLSLLHLGHLRLATHFLFRLLPRQLNVAFLLVLEHPVLSHLHLFFLLLFPHSLHLLLVVLLVPLLLLHDVLGSLLRLVDFLPSLKYQLLNRGYFLLFLL